MLEFKKLVILLFILLNVAVVLYFAYTWTSSNGSGQKAPKSNEPAAAFNNSFIEQQDEETKALIQSLAQKYTDEELGKLLEKSTLAPSEPTPQIQPPEEETGSETEGSKTRRIRVVTMMTDDNLSAIRGFVGRFHTLFPPDSEFKAGIKDENLAQKLSITIYGLRLNPVHEGEIRLWKNVDFIDVFSELVSSNMISVNGKVIPEEHQVKRLDVWRPIVLKHAVEKYGKILYLDPNIVPTEAGHIDAIDKHLDGKDTGSIYTLNTDAKEDVLATDDKSNTMCNFGMIGMKLGSYAYTNILIPQVRCSMARICSHDELKLWSPENRKGDIPKAAYCTGQFKTAIRPFSESAEGPCTIVHREDIMFSPMQVSKLQTLENAKKVRESDPNRIHIALGFPATSKGNANPQIGNVPFFSTFLPTFLQTISPGDANGYLYKLYMGIDYFDPFYDNPQIQKEIKAEVYRRAAGYPVEFEIVRCAPSRGWVVYLWNILFQYAIENGADYFYQLNDDIRFISGGWAGGLTKILRDNSVKSNLGVSGPRDTNNGGLLTQSFVHKTHYEIFGYYYPPIFENWYSDDWVTVVYSKARSVFRTDIQVHNSQNFGTRYHVCSDAGKARLETAKKRGEELIDQWLAEHK